MLTRRITSTDEAARILADGGLVAFPTETVFGLGADATNRQAIEALFRAKGRPSDNPLIVHVSKIDDWSLAAESISPHAAALMQAYSPGPLTVVLPKRTDISDLVSAGLKTVGIRIPDHPVAREIIDLAQRPIAAPSANRSGRPSSTTWKSVLEDLDGHVDAVFCENGDHIGIESTVVDCCGEFPVLLRPGAITLEQIQKVVPEATAFTSADTSSVDRDRINSPGLLHPHYQPRARVKLIDYPSLEMIAPAQSSAYCGMHHFEGVETLALWKVFETVEQYAAGFYEFLRETDRHEVSTVFVQPAPDQGIGNALRDRQCRAAAS